MPRPLDRLLDRIERAEVIDRVAEPLRESARPLTDEPLSSALSGAWMGHALHPLATDAVIGTWLSAWALDLVGGERARPAARRLIGLGILAYGPTALSGTHDWVDEQQRARRLGMVHAAANSIGLGLQLASWVARGRGRHGRGVALSTAAMAAVGVGGFLGGHLSYVLGTGVSRTAFQDAPEGWTPTVTRSDLHHGPRSVDVDGTPVLLVDDGGAVRALADTCTHAGCSLAGGEVADGAVTCPCHGSRFTLADGAVEAGPAHTPQPSFDTRIVDGVIEVRRHRS